MPTPSPFNLLIFSKTTGYRHTSIPSGINCIRSLADRTKSFTVTATEDATLFTPSNLCQYAVIVLLQCIGDIFSPSQLSALKNFVHSGGGVVAIHGAAAGMPSDSWYGKLIGAQFKEHPPAEQGTVLMESANESHFIPSCCGGRENWMDEWYNFTSHPRSNQNLKILLRGDPKTFEGGEHSADHPLAWCQDFEGGRSFLTALGHFDEAYEDEWFVGMVERGIMWAAGKDG